MEGGEKGCGAGRSHYFSGRSSANALTSYNEAPMN